MQPRSLLALVVLAVPARLALVALVLGLGACQSLSEGLVSLTARAVLYDDAEIDDFDAATSFEEEDVELSGYGLQAAVMTPILDVTAAVDRREFEDEEVDELSLGVRRRFLEIWRLHPYVAADLRFGFDLDTGFDEEDYTGWDAGVGLLLDLTDHLFLDGRLVYERTSDDIALPGGDTHLDGIVGTVGLGFSL